jgi:8-oxo-dGTP diphosphatase
VTGGDAAGRAYPARPVVGVGAVVLVTEAGRAAIAYDSPLPAAGGVVLIRRRFEPLAGEWSLPGGTVEVGETLEAAVAREVAEETGLVVEVGPVIEVFDRIMRDGDARVQYHFVLVDYLCRPRGGRLQHGSDVSDAIIADPARLEQFRLTEKALDVIRRAINLGRLSEAGNT